jgi:hypothetical protein
MMFSALTALVLLVTPLSVPAQTGALGHWKAEFVGPIGDRPKMVSEITFTLESGSAGLSRSGRAGIWPGDLELSSIVLDGDRVRFTGTSDQTWSTKMFGEPLVVHCCPQLTFEGTVRDDVMILNMTWRSTENPDDPTARAVPMIATRVSDAGAER